MLTLMRLVNGSKSLPVVTVSSPHKIFPLLGTKRESSNRIDDMNIVCVIDSSNTVFTDKVSLNIINII